MIDLAKIRVGIVVSRFNSYISQLLVNGAMETLRARGINPEQVEVLWVPGCLEIPWACSQLIQTRSITALIALGAVIRGETFHFDIVASESARGLMDVSVSTGVPILNGILTVDNEAQALSRAGIKGGNKGSDCASGLLDCLELKASLEIRSHASHR